MKLKIKAKDLKRNDVLNFFGMLALAYVVSLVPILNWPFSWVETFFHEMSHGIIALVTGGTIKAVKLNLDGSGYCITSGGINIFIAFAGYAGAVFWGALIYSITDHTSEKRADRLSVFILALIAVTAVFWARDVVTFFILAVIAMPFALILRTKEIEAERRFMQLLGLYVLLNALKSPTYLLDGESKGDGANLYNMTWIPEIVWIGIWLALGGFALFILFRRHVKFERTKSKAG